MKIISDSIDEKGHFHDRFGKRGEEFSKGIPTRSIDFEILEAPKDTKSYAFILSDHDAMPVVGFTWIHWSGANLKNNKVEENESINADFIQGTNSWASSLMGENAITGEESVKYGGMMPPDEVHEYELTVYALDCESLDIKEEFFVNELYKAMRGHVLEETKLIGKYRN